MFATIIIGSILQKPLHNTQFIPLAEVGGGEILAYYLLKKETKQWIVTCITEELALSTTLIDADTIPEVIKLGKKQGIDPDNIMSIVLYKHVKIEN